MSTEALCLLLGQHHLQQNGSRRALILQLETHTQRQTPGQQSNHTLPISTETAPGFPRTELAELIASIVKEKINNCPSSQDGGASGVVSSNTRPSLLSNPGPSTLQPIQDGGLTAGQQLPECGHQTAFQPLPSSTQPPSSINPSLSYLDISDPAHMVSLLPDFQQPFLASHLTKATSTAFMNDGSLPFLGSHSLHHPSISDEHLRASVQQYLRASLAPSTRRTYQAGLKHFLTLTSCMV